MTNIRIPNLSFRIVYNFSVPCSGVSFTQEIDICLIVCAIFEQNGETIYVWLLKIPLQILKTSTNKDYVIYNYENQYILNINMKVEKQISTSG